MRQTNADFIDTRSAAHASIIPVKRTVYSAILHFAHDQKQKGLTADELVAAWGCSPNHVAPRIKELADSGELIDSGRRRPTRTGRLARVFVVPEGFKNLTSDLVVQQRVESEQRRGSGEAGPPSPPNNISPNAPADSLFGNLSIDRSYRE